MKIPWNLIIPDQQKLNEELRRFQQPLILATLFIGSIVIVGIQFNFVINKRWKNDDQKTNDISSTIILLVVVLGTLGANIRPKLTSMIVLIVRLLISFFICFIYI